MVIGNYAVRILFHCWPGGLLVSKFADLWLIIISGKQRVMMITEKFRFIRKKVEKQTRRLSRVKTQRPQRTAKRKGIIVCNYSARLNWARHLHLGKIIYPQISQMDADLKIPNQVGFNRRNLCNLRIILDLSVTIVLIQDLQAFLCALCLWF